RREGCQFAREADDQPRRRHHALAVAFPLQHQPHDAFLQEAGRSVGFTITFLNIISWQQQPATAAAAAAAAAADVAGERRLHEPHDTGSAVAKEGIKLDIMRIHMALPEMSTFGGVGVDVMERFCSAVNSLAPQIEQLQQQSHDPPITCVISDLLVSGITQSAADKLNLPRIALYTNCQSHLLLQKGAVPLVFKALEARESLTWTISSNEGSLAYLQLKFVTLWITMETINFGYTWMLQKSLQETKSKAHAIAINNFKEIEEDALKVNIGIPVYAVGPLVEPLENDLITSFWKEDEACLLWQDSQPCLSILFISFGSIASLSLPQYGELVGGILINKQRFLWVLHSRFVKDTPVTASLEKLSSKSHDRGYVTQWAPQAKVLSHPSISGFLTHCGWNATVEAVSHGVPMICYLIFGDQFFKWKVGLSLEENKETGLIKREEIQRVIQILAIREGEYL
ncbi:hypothetical protein GOP47_0028853, partial [Adiantum capillus-veneris]